MLGTTSTMMHQARCRYCWATVDAAAAGDPAPGICPDCLSDHLGAALARFAWCVETLPPREAVWAAYQDLLCLGMRPLAAETFLVAALARVLA